MIKPWNGEEFRGRMERLASEAQRYADEHDARIGRGAANGKASVRDEYLGRSDLCAILSTHNATEGLVALHEFLVEQKKLLESGVLTVKVENEKSYRRGGLSQLEKIMEDLKIV